jgi:hypothetical protein
LGVGHFWRYFRHAIKHGLSNAIAPAQHLFLKQKTLSTSKYDSFASLSMRSTHISMQTQC